ncbi:MAG: TetR family transcriptional regulator [Gemmatimonadetes bacterium]|nr:MAG: TetR family transcriptional regulator [Gemmatimonadota bacterium]
MPRTKAFQPAEALDRAMELFWRRGYAATGLDELVRRTGASRYGLYATFGGKRDLFLASLERYSQAVMDPMIGPLDAVGASAPEIRGFFERVLGVIATPGDGRGCLMCNAAFERGTIDHAAARRVGRHFDRVRRTLARALANARRDGRLSDDVPVPAYADHLLGAAAGSFLLARSGMAIGFIRRFVDTALTGLT